jgi:hypothetical protein
MSKHEQEKQWWSRRIKQMNCWRQCSWDHIRFHFTALNYLDSTFTKQLSNTLQELFVFWWIGVAHVTEEFWRERGYSWECPTGSTIYSVPNTESIWVVKTNHCKQARTEPPVKSELFPFWDSHREYSIRLTGSFLTMSQDGLFGSRSSLFRCIYRAQCYNLQDTRNTASLLQICVQLSRVILSLYATAKIEFLLPTISSISSLHGSPILCKHFLWPC